MATPILLRLIPSLSKLLFYRGHKAKLGAVELGDNLSIDGDGRLSASMVPGPQGEQGPQGEVGPEGPSRRIETYFGETNGSGDYSVTYDPVFADIPCVTPQLISTANSRTWRVSSSTVSGFTVRVEERSQVTVLGVQVVGFTTTPVSGAELNVTVVEAD